jgi:hypothetical protein
MLLVRTSMPPWIGHGLIVRLGKGARPLPSQGGKGARPLPPYRDAGHTGGSAASLLRSTAHDRACAVTVRRHATLSRDLCRTSSVSLSVSLSQCSLSVRTLLRNLLPVSHCSCASYPALRRCIHVVGAVVSL